MKKTLLCIGISLCSINQAQANDQNNIVGYWVGANGAFVGNNYKSESFSRDNLILNQSSINTDSGKINYSGAVRSTTMYYKSTDCSGTIYIEAAGDPRFPGEEYGPNFLFLSSDNTINKKVMFYELSEPKLMGDFNSQSNLGPDTQPICKENTPLTGYYYGIYMQAVSNTPENFANKYPWLGFVMENSNTHEATPIIKGATLPFKYIEINKEPKTDIVEEPKIYPAVGKHITVNVTAQGKLSYVTVTKGGPIYQGDITSKKFSNGKYDITFPNTFMSSEQTNDNTQLNCSLNKDSQNYVSKMSISCYKLNDQPIIRVITSSNFIPSNSRFTLDVQW